MGSDKNEGSGARLRRPRDSKDVGNVADWESADSELLKKTIATAGIHHCALRFGYSRDGGAYAIGVYAGNDYFTDYVRPGESIDDYLRDLCEVLAEYTGEKAPEKRSKRA
jgi:hypothetical protein